MPKLNDARIHPETGDVSFAYMKQMILDEAPVTDDNGATISSDAVSGENIGTGDGVYKETKSTAEGTKLVFKTLGTDDTLKIIDTGKTLVFGLSDVMQRPDISTLSGVLSVEHGGTGHITLPVNSILLGNGAAPITAIAAPNANAFLAYENNRYVWKEVKQYHSSVSAGTGIDVSGITANDFTTYTVSVKQDDLDLNGFKGFAAIGKGGTGMNKVGTAGSFLKSNGMSLDYTSIAYTDVSGLSTVASTGDFNDLINKPSNKGTVTMIGINSQSNVIDIIDSPVTEAGFISLAFRPENINLSSLSGVLSVNKGGTGVNSLGDNGLLIGNSLSGATVLPKPDRKSVLKFKNGSIRWNVEEQPFYRSMSDALVEHRGDNQVFAVMSNDSKLAFTMHYNGTNDVTVDMKKVLSDGFITELTSSTEKDKGAGLIGYNPALQYNQGTVGFYLKDNQTENALLRTEHDNLVAILQNREAGKGITFIGNAIARVKTYHDLTTKIQPDTECTYFLESYYPDWTNCVVKGQPRGAGIFKCIKDINPAIIDGGVVVRSEVDQNYCFVRMYGNENVCPDWWGAKGDYTHDDTVAFQKAVDFNPLSFVNPDHESDGFTHINKWSKTIELGKGQYRITGKIRSMFDLHIIGKGKDDTLIVSEHDGSAFVFTNASASYRSGIKVDHLTIMNMGVNEQTEGAGVELQTTPDFLAFDHIKPVFNNVRVTGFNRGVVVGDGIDFDAIDCEFTDNNYEGLSTVGATHNAKTTFNLVNVNLKGNGTYGASIRNVKRVTLSNTDAVGNGVAGVHIKGADTVVLDYSTAVLSNNGFIIEDAKVVTGTVTIDEMDNSGIVLNNVKNLTLTGGSLKGSAGYGIQTVCPDCKIRVIGTVFDGHYQDNKHNLPVDHDIVII